MNLPMSSGALVVKRIKRERTQSIKIAHAYGYITDKETGELRKVKFKDCWLPYEWYNQKNERRELSFKEVTPEEVQVYNPITKRGEMHFKRFKFNIPNWLVKSDDNPNGNLRQELVGKDDQLELFNDDDPITVIEEQSEEFTQSSDERALDLKGMQYQMFDSPVNIAGGLEQEIQEEFDSLSYGIN